VNDRRVYCPSVKLTDIVTTPMNQLGRLQIGEPALNAKSSVNPSQQSGYNDNQSLPMHEKTVELVFLIHLPDYISLPIFPYAPAYWEKTHANASSTFPPPRLRLTSFQVCSKQRNALSCSMPRLAAESLASQAVQDAGLDSLAPHSAEDASWLKLSLSCDFDNVPMRRH
jgi:hypothetical protein